MLGGNWSKVVTERLYIPPGEPTVKIGEIDVPLSRAYPHGYEMIPGAGGKKVMAKGLPRPQAQPSGSSLDEIAEMISQPTEESLFELPVGTTPAGNSAEQREIQFDVPIVLTFGYIEYRGVRRDSVGGDMLLSLGKEFGARVMNTYKGSDTDMFKRCARYWGVGLYLTQLSTASVKVVDDATLCRFLNERYPNDKRFMTPNNAMKHLFASMKEAGRVETGAELRNMLEDRGIVFTTDRYYEIERMLLEDGG